MRRISAFATLAVLLVGCQSPIPTDPEKSQPTPSLSAEIAGPSQINAIGQFSWEAFAFGGSGAYQYQWEVARQLGEQATTATLVGTTGTQRKLSLQITGSGGDLLLRLTVRSGDQAYIGSIEVRNCIGGCR